MAAVAPRLVWLAKLQARRPTKEAPTAANVATIPARTTSEQPARAQKIILQTLQQATHARFGLQ
jgi:hypothetical protein